MRQVLGQEDTAVGRHDGVVFEQVIESRAAAVAWVRTLDWLGELHLIPDQDDGLGGGGHRDEVSERDLTGLVHEKHVARAAKLVPREKPRGPADDRQGKIDVAVIRDSLDVTAPLVAVPALPILLLAEPAFWRAGLRQARLDRVQHVVDCLVAVRGDADRLAGLDERHDQVRGRVGLAGAGWSLDDKPGAIERMDGALCCLEQPRRVVPVGLGHDRRAGARPISRGGSRRRRAWMCGKTLPSPVMSFATAQTALRSTVS